MESKKDTLKNSQSVAFKFKERPSRNSDTEKRFIERMVLVLPFLELSDMANIINLNYVIRETLPNTIKIIIYMIREHYLKVENPHPNNRKFFKKLLSRLEKKNLALSHNQSEIFSRALKRMDFSMNLVKNSFFTKELKGWEIIQNGGDGWKIEELFAIKHRKYSIASSYSQCSMKYRVKFSNFSGDFLNHFSEGKAVINAGCWIGRRWDCKATEDVM